MAVPFKCWDCGADATRCRCHENRPHRHRPLPLSPDDRIAENEVILKHTLEKMRRMRGGG